MFYGRRKKTTDVAKDGSSKSVEHSEEQSAFKGAGTGTMKAIATGQAEVGLRFHNHVAMIILAWFGEELTCC